MPLIPQNLHLLLIQPREAEHANLSRNVVPGARRTTLLQPLPQTATHLLNAPAHRAQILLPLLEEYGVVEDLAGNARTIRGGIRNLRALQDSQLARDMLDSSGRIRTRRRDKVERTRALTVQTKVLRKRLRNAQLKALLDEVADRPGVADQIAGREALVGSVEEGELAALAHDGRDLLPLVLRGVNACGIVCAGVQEDDGAERRCPQRAHHAVEVEALGLGREVGVVGEGEADIGEDLVVIGPGGIGEVDGGLGLRGVELGEEEAAQVNGAGSRDGLEGADL